MGIKRIRTLRGRIKGSVGLVIGITMLASFGVTRPAGATEGPEPVSVVAGANHSCALMADRTVRCWGANDRGQLGDGTTRDRTLPVVVAGMRDVAQLTAGSNHTCALNSTGALFCWGDNRDGQLGDGRTTTFRSLPYPVAPTLRFDLVDASDISTCSAARDLLYCWGTSLGYALGMPTSPSRPTLVRTLAARRIFSLAVMRYSVCAYVVDVGPTDPNVSHSPTALKCSGTNYSGIWGGGTPVVGGFATIETGTTYGGYPELDGRIAHMCRLWRGVPLGLRCAGSNAAGQLGVGSVGPDRYSPSPVTGSYSVMSVGYSHTCAFERNTSQYRCWGANTAGQLAVATSGRPLSSPTAVGGFGPPAVWTDVSIAAGLEHTCAIGRDPAGVKQVYCWGSDSRGQLGNGYLGGSATPQRVGDGALIIRPITLPVGQVISS